MSLLWDGSGIAMPFFGMNKKKRWNHNICGDGLLLLPYMVV
ncbi:MAG: hypothetical protein ACI4F4_01350 [Lachnospiraceae bacterium]